MKTLNHWTIFLSIFIITALTFFLTSCSSDPDVAPAATSDEFSQKITGTYPENAANIYDAVGQLHNEITESYLSGKLVSSSTAGTIAQVEALADPNIEFQALKPSDYVSPTASEIEVLLIGHKGNMLDVVANSNMTTASKLSLIEFLNSVMLQYEQQVDFDSIHKYILDYEDSIISNSALPAADSKVILCTTSIARYGFYFAKKNRRKPRDWDWSISWGNLTAGTLGSNQSASKAVIMSAVCGILSNEGF